MCATRTGAASARAKVWRSRSSMIASKNQRIHANWSDLRVKKNMHDVPSSEHWHEPQGLKNAGYGAWKRPNTSYDDFMESQGIPIFRGIGVKRVQDMPLKPWKRMGGRGTFIQLFGTEGKWGCYVVEVPGAGALNPERHMYEEIMVLVEGRGTTEIWTDDQKKAHSFEWQRGSMFAVPLNTWHRIVNAASSPALILVAST